MGMITSRRPLESPRLERCVDCGVGEELYRVGSYWTCFRCWIYERSGNFGSSYGRMLEEEDSGSLTWLLGSGRWSA
jgi:hypothetical protein